MQEIKSVNIANSDEASYIQAYQSFGWTLKSSQRIFNQTTRPVDAISFKDVTYIESETETVDFVRLVFERDTKMRFYDDITDLESEFWRLAEEVSTGRPFMPPDIDNVESWARRFEPELRTRNEKAGLHWVFGTITGLFVSIVGGIIVLLEELGELGDGEMLAWIFIIGGITLGFSWYIGNKIAKQHSVSSAINDPKSKYRPRLENMYQALIDEIDTYDYNVSRMKELLKESKDLINWKFGQELPLNED